MNAAVVMLDLDGTIIDTSELYLQGIPPIAKKYLGINITPEDILPMWGQFARNFFVHYAHENDIKDDSLIDTMYEEYSIFYNEMHNELSFPYEYVSEYLPKIREYVYSLGIVTTRPTLRSKPVLEMEWAKNVDFFVWGDQVPRKKPFPDGLNFAMKNYSNGYKKGIYIGDNAHDIEAAKACQYPITSIGALWGTMDKNRLLKAKPDKAFATFKEFACWILDM